MDNSKPRTQTSLETLYTDTQAVGVNNKQNDTEKEFETDINRYTIEELVDLFGLQYPLKNDNINFVMNEYISSTNDDLYKSFFMEAKTRLLKIYNERNTLTVTEQLDIDTNRYYSVSELISIFDIDTPLTKLDIETKIGNLKETTQEPDYLEFYDDALKRLLDEHYNQETKSNYSVPIVEGTVNPHKKEIITRVISLDSQYRSIRTSCNGVIETHEYTCMLSEPVYNVVSIAMDQYEIPMSWNLIDSRKGNNFFYIHKYTNSAESDSDVFDVSLYKITVPDGNYKPTMLVNTIQGLINDTSDISLNFQYNISSRKVDIKINELVTDHYYRIVFYDEKNDEFSNVLKNDTLGDIIGYQVESADTIKEVFVSNEIFGLENVVTNMVTGNAQVNTYGTQYIYIVLDDLNQNRVTNSIVGISEGDTITQLPSYYHCNLNRDDPRFLKDGSPSGLSMAKAETILSILATNQQNTKTNSYAMSSQDIFARIPISESPTNVDPDDTHKMVKQESSVIQYRREYFGPVTLRRLKCRILDDKGRNLDLNGLNWSLSIRCECLYSNTGSYTYTPIKGKGKNTFGLDPISETS